MAKISSVLGWKDQRGYTLSDRIWNLSLTTEARILAAVDDGLTRGMSAKDLAAYVERFLIPGRGSRTNKPFGDDFAFDAVRLAISETTRANAISIIASAMTSPVPMRIFYNLSAAHVSRPGDPCETFAAVSDSQGGYEPEECPIPMEDTHPWCLCYLEAVSITDTFTLVEAVQDLLSRMARRLAAPFTAMARRWFIAFLLGLIGVAALSSSEDDDNQFEDIDDEDF